jgi:hypothetical protein
VTSLLNNLSRYIGKKEKVASRLMIDAILKIWSTRNFESNTWFDGKDPPTMCPGNPEKVSLVMILI